MGEICNSKQDTALAQSSHDLAEVTEGILLDTHTDITRTNTLSVPISQLAALGAGVASLVPALRTVTQTTTVSTQGLYQLANAAVGDTLKAAKNGNFWGALKTADGASKFAQLKAADPLSATNTTVLPFSPATMMMAVALFSIEQQLGNLAEMEKQILSFLEIEKQSEIEADVETLSNIIAKYKFNWDNEHFIASNHKMVLDIQRTARKNMISYQKKVDEILHSRQLLVSQMKVNSVLKDLLRKFKYYRLSLYTFTMATFLEIMLSGNFKEENISENLSEIEALSMDYRDLFMQCSAHLEQLSKSSLETNFITGVGKASTAVGKFIGSIPVVKEGPVDEFLQDRGKRLDKNAHDMELDTLTSFASISNPGTGVFMEKMRDMVQIYNHTAKICFDDERIYLIAG